MVNVKMVEINNLFAIQKTPECTFILADVKTDKETKEKHYPTRAIYSNELNLVADLVNLSVKRGVYLKAINSVSDVMRESNYIAELGRKALNKLNKEKE